MQWVFQFLGGDPVPDYPHPGTRRFVVNGWVESTTTPRTEIARIEKLEVLVSPKGVFPDLRELHRQVADPDRRQALLVQLDAAVVAERLDRIR